MIGYYDPDSLKVGETEGVISFINASDANDVKEDQINTQKVAKTVVAALKDQMNHGLAGLNGRFRKVQGTFTRVPGSMSEGIIVDAKGGKEVPVRMGFGVKPGDVPARGVCIAIGEMGDGALMVDRLTLAPIAPMPVPNPGIQTPNS